jgi:hypothetical protein
VRALNENSWLYYTDWFWYLGWFEHRFGVRESVYLDAQLQPCGRDHAHFMRMCLVKQPTTLAERMTARCMRPDFGGIDDDLGESTGTAADTPTHSDADSSVALTPQEALHA